MTLPELPLGGILLKHRRGELITNPITHPLELALLLETWCGATGYRISNGQVLALRFDASGSEVVIDRFEIHQVRHQ